MTGWLQIARERAARGEASVLVTVCSVEGSAPREAGTKMLVWADGQHGTIGGGNLEFIVTAQARKLLASGATHCFQSYPLGPLLGQCCGGRVGLLLERIDAALARWLDEAAALEDAGHPHAIHTELKADAVEKRVADLRGLNVLDDAPVRLFDGAGRVMGAARADSAIGAVVERIDPRPLLLMFGAGHVGKALAPILATLPLRVQWFDTRLDLGRPEGPLQPVIDADLVARAQVAPPGALYLVFTQSHDLDYALTRAILARSDFLYCGLIGSATKRARFEKRLVADGVSRATLSRLVCPIGNIGLTSKAPEVLAIAVAAELLSTIQSSAAARTSKAVHGN